MRRMCGVAGVKWAFLGVEGTEGERDWVGGCVFRVYTSYTRSPVGKLYVLFSTKA